MRLRLTTPRGGDGGEVEPEGRGRAADCELVVVVVAITANDEAAGCEDVGDSLGEGNRNMLCGACLPSNEEVQCPRGTYTPAWRNVPRTAYVTAAVELTRGSTDTSSPDGLHLVTMVSKTLCFLQAAPGQKSLTQVLLLCKSHSKVSRKSSAKDTTGNVTHREAKMMRTVGVNDCGTH